MLLKFKKITYSNIMSVGAKPFEIDLDSHKKTLITGLNGGGKSTLIEALCFGLFGKPFRDLKLGQLINSVNKKKLLVEIALSYGADEFLIKRGIKPKVFEIYKNGTLIPKDASDTEYQNKFEELISMNINSFKQVIVLGTAGYVPFMKLDTPKRRKLVEDLLNLSVLSEMDKLNKEYVKTINQNLSTLQLQIDHTTKEIATNERFINEQKAKSQSNVSQYEELRNERMERITVLKSELVELRDKIAEVVIDSVDHTESINRLRDGLSKLKYQTEQLSKLNIMYEKGGDCPSCKQPIQPSKETVQELLTNISNNKVRMTKISTKQDELTEIMRELSKQQQQMRNMKTEYDSKKNVIQNEISQIKKLDAIIAEHQNDVVIDTTELDKLNSELSILSVTLGKYTKERYLRSIIVDMLKDSGIKSNIVNQYIPYFNKEIQRYLDIMDADYSFTLDSEFNETIKSYGREEFTYNSFSEGEKSRIDLSLLFTWRSVSSKLSGVNLSLLILDEVFDSSMDGNGAYATAKILDEIDCNVIVISHKDLNPQDYDRHIHMKKQGRLSNITIKEY